MATEQTTRYHQSTNARYDGDATIARYAEHLINIKAYLSTDFDNGGSSVYYALWDNEGHRDPMWANAFNHARRTPEFAAYLAREMNDSMFDESFGDVEERTGDSAMASAFANLMADAVLRRLGELAAQDIGRGTVPAPTF